MAIDDETAKAALSALALHVSRELTAEDWDRLLEGPIPLCKVDHDQIAMLTSWPYQHSDLAGFTVPGEEPMRWVHKRDLRLTLAPGVLALRKGTRIEIR